MQKQATHVLALVMFLGTVGRCEGKVQLALKRHNSHVNSKNSEFASYHSENCENQFNGITER